MIKYAKIEGINDRAEIDAKFNSDINIITGVNGCGKTTVLKLLWYTVSSNLERVFDECKFRNLHIEFDEGYISIKPEFSKNSKITDVKVNAEINGDKFNQEFQFSDYEMGIEELNQICFKQFKSTVMFPTFRRIEGGFSLNSNERSTIQNRIEHYSRQIQNGLEQISARIGFNQHKFVTSISTNDLKQYVTNSYAEISKSTNRLHARLTRKINEVLSAGSDVTAEEKLIKIEEETKEISSHQERLLRPFTVLSELVVKIIKHKGIKLTEGMKFGDAGVTIDSDSLSSGEKQILSFLCYNAFTKNGIIVIDEPELSLHVDWQRELIGILLEQNATNQFILATHSPMIYGKYDDKEIPLKVLA